MTRNTTLTIVTFIFVILGIAWAIFMPEPTYTGWVEVITLVLSRWMEICLAPMLVLLWMSKARKLDRPLGETLHLGIIVLEAAWAQLNNAMEDDQTRMWASLVIYGFLVMASAHSIAYFIINY